MFIILYVIDYVATDHCSICDKIVSTFSVLLTINSM